jgi:hypothetical protein
MAGIAAQVKMGAFRRDLDASIVDADHNSYQRGMDTVPI